LPEVDESNLEAYDTQQPDQTLERPCILSPFPPVATAHADASGSDASLTGPRNPLVHGAMHHGTAHTHSSGSAVTLTAPLAQSTDFDILEVSLKLTEDNMIVTCFFSLSLSFPPPLHPTPRSLPLSRHGGHVDGS